MGSIVALTFDIERENFLKKGKNTHGIEEGLPLLIDFLVSNDLPATFFVSANLCEDFPEIIRELGNKFEIASHGYQHERFTTMTEQNIEALKTSKDLLEKTSRQEVLGFRAPFLTICPKLFETLTQLGFKYDSSIPLFKKKKPLVPQNQIKEFPPFVSNAIIRFPYGLRKLKRAIPPDQVAVVYFHPWEFVNMKKHVSIKDFFLRPDRWIKTGRKFLSLFEQIIAHFQDINYEFRRLGELI